MTDKDTPEQLSAEADTGTKAKTKKPSLLERVRKYQSEHPTAFAFSLIGLSVICFGLGSLLQSW